MEREAVILNTSIVTDLQASVVELEGDARWKAEEWCSEHHHLRLHMDQLELANSELLVLPITKPRAD